MNGMINLMKFLFAFAVFGLHGSEIFGGHFFPGGWISVEFFFIFCGFTLAQRAEKLPDISGAGAIGEETFSTLKKRILKIFPYLLSAALLSFLLKHIIVSGFSSWKTDTLRMIPEVFMSQMAGFPGYWATGVSWFLSAMWIGIALVYPLMLSGKALFRKVLAPLFAVLIYGYLVITTGTLTEPGRFLGLVFKGTLRALAGICLGCSSFEISRVLREKKWSSYGIAAAEITGYLVLFVIMMVKNDGETYAYLPFVIMVLIGISGSGCDGFSEKLDGRITRFLGDVSMILYLNHYYVADIIQNRFPGGALWKKFALYAAVTGVIVLANVLVKTLIEKKKKRA